MTRGRVEILLVVPRCPGPVPTRRWQPGWVWNSGLEMRFLRNFENVASVLKFLERPEEIRCHSNLILGSLNVTFFFSSSLETFRDFPDPCCMTVWLGVGPFYTHSDYTRDSAQLDSHLL